MAFCTRMMGLNIPVFIGLFLLVGCKEEPTITSVNFGETEFGHFVEPDFPYITTSMDARALGEGFPEENIAARVLAVKLGGDAAMAFDTDMLRWSVAWTGDFLPMVTMAQISYNDFHNKDNLLPVIGGEPKIATGQYPGWTGKDPQFQDPRPPASNPNGLPWGPLPEALGRWNGVYVVNDGVVLSYSVGGADIFEKPGMVQIEEESAFTRTFEIEGQNETLHLMAAEITDGIRHEVDGRTAYLYHGAEGKLLTAVGVSGDAEGIEIVIKDNRYLMVQVAAQERTGPFSVVLWRGNADQQALFGQLFDKANGDFPDYEKGSSARWKEAVLTMGQLSPDTAAYVVDDLTLPIPNPWSRNVRLVDISFFDGDIAAAVSFEGDVWIVEGINDKLGRLSWKRYASGLYEPQSIEVVEGQIYVFGKEGIVRFHDLNNDGEADYYENFSNIMAQSIETREWAADMVAAPEGGFYVAKFGGLDMGPETSSPKSLMGFRTGSPHDGSILKIAPDGRSLEVIATGFRGPYIGINPETGVLSASDQQGHYMPSTPVMLINKGDYYGVPATAHRDPIPEITPPLLWIPHGVDRSGVGQVWINSDKMGSLNGHMIHLSYGRPGLFKVLIDSVGQQIQGGVSIIEGNYPAPTMKGAINPKDGQLYFTGFSLWGTNTPTISALGRLRYTGRESLLPEAFAVRNQGIAIRFNVALDESSVTDISKYQVKRWNYQRTEKYGSGHFRMDGSPGDENMPVLKAFLSDDKKTVFLAVPNMEKVMQMSLSYQLKTSSGLDFQDDFYFTVNELVEPDLSRLGFSGLTIDDVSFDFDPSQLTTKDVTPTAELGGEMFVKMGCIACHAVQNDDQAKIGPPMTGLYGSSRTFTDGTSTTADEAYLLESIVSPGAKVVEGREGEMPSFLGILSEAEMESVILYIKSLAD
jgi:cytochrome c2